MNKIIQFIDSEKQDCLISALEKANDWMEEEDKNITVISMSSYLVVVTSFSNKRDYEVINILYRTNS